MSYPVILQFAADYPWTAFFISWPTTFLIMSAAWMVATLLTNAMNTLLMAFGQLTSFIAVLARGYAPMEKGKDGGGKGQGGENGEDDDGETRPLAG